MDVLVDEAAKLVDQIIDRQEADEYILVCLNFILLPLFLAKIHPSAAG